MLTTIRHIHADELRSFSQFAACEDRGFLPSSPAEFEVALSKLWQLGQSAPYHCFLAEHEDQPLAAAVFWMRGNRAHLEHVRLPTNDPHILDRLLTESLAQLRASDITSVWTELLTPPLREPRTSILSSSLERVGFGKGRERLTFLWKAGDGAVEASTRLTFRSLAELGQEDFIRAWAGMTADSLDAGIAKDMNEKAPLAYASDAFAEEALTPHEPSWWEIAYDQNDTAVGMVLAGVVGRQPAILFVAVKPGHRGQGYSRDLLKRGISTLASTGVKSVRGDVDVANTPMVEAFRAVGFNKIRSCRMYEWDLSS